MEKTLIIVVVLFLLFLVFKLWEVSIDIVDWNIIIYYYDMKKKQRMSFIIKLR